MFMYVHALLQLRLDFYVHALLQLRLDVYVRALLYFVTSSLVTRELSQTTTDRKLQ